jgi:hypothetical protein
MSTLSLAFESLNLRFNPFGELSRLDRVAVAVVELGDWPQRLTTHKTAIQFLGPHGHGKSTHLLSLHQHFSSSPYTQLYPDFLPTLKRAEIQFVDSFDLLKIKARREVHALSGSLAFTTHVDLSKELNKAGFKVVTQKFEDPPEGLLEEVVRRRMEFARRAPGHLPPITGEHLQQLTHKHGNNIREIESDLYDHIQQLEKKHHG